MDEKAKDTLHATLEQAYDEMDKEPAATPAVPEKEAPPAEPAKVQATPGERPRDDKGRFAPLESEGKPPAKAEPEAPPAVVQTTLPGVEPAPPPPAAPDVPPPASWRATERELWSKIPKEARDPILRREKETGDAIGRANIAVENWKRFQETYRPYEHIMRMNGSRDPIESAENLFRTAAVLQTGNPYQRAQTIAQVMQQFDIDPGLVASHLQGQPPPPQGQGTFQDPRFTQFLQTLEQSKAEREQAAEANVRTAMDTFGKSHEFFEDLREEMADLVDAWDRAGKLDESNLPAALEKAYNLAALSNEEVAKVMKQREAAKAVTQSSAVTEKSRAAASSVKSTAVPGTGKPKSLSEVLSAKYDELASR